MSVLTGCRVWVTACVEDSACGPSGTCVFNATLSQGVCVCAPGVAHVVLNEPRSACGVAVPTPCPGYGFLDAAGTCVCPWNRAGPPACVRCAPGVSGAACTVGWGPHLQPSAFQTPTPSESPSRGVANSASASGSGSGSASASASASGSRSNSRSGSRSRSRSRGTSASGSASSSPSPSASNSGSNSAVVLPVPCGSVPGQGGCAECPWCSAAVGPVGTCLLEPGGRGVCGCPPHTVPLPGGNPEGWPGLAPAPAECFHSNATARMPLPGAVTNLGTALSQNAMNAARDTSGLSGPGMALLVVLGVLAAAVGAVAAWVAIQWGNGDGYTRL